MKTVWKYKIPISDDIVDLNIPVDGKILHFDVQHEEPCIWVLVESTNDTEHRKFRVYGTGHRVIEDAKGTHQQYIGTAQMLGGSLIWHLFEVLEDEK